MNSNILFGQNQRPYIQLYIFVMETLRAENPDIEKRIQRDVAVAEKMWGMEILTRVHYLPSLFAVKKLEIMRNIRSLQARKLFRQGQEVCSDMKDLHVYYVPHSYLKGRKGSGVVGLYYGKIPQIGRDPNYDVLPTDDNGYNIIFIANQPKGQYTLAHEIGHALFYNHPILKGYDPDTLRRGRTPDAHHPDPGNLMFNSVPTGPYQPPRTITRTQRQMALQSEIVKIIAGKS